MEENLWQKETATLVEQEISEEVKKEKAKEILFSNISVQREAYEEKKLSPVNLSFENVFSEPVSEVKPEVEIKEEELQEEIKETEEEQTENTEEVLQEETEIKSEEDVKDEVFVERKIKPKTNFALRLKIAVCAFALVLTCVCGWSIYNAIKVKTLTAELQAEQAKYSVNVVKVISNIQKLDDLSNPNSITNLDELEKAEVVNIVPKEEKTPQQLEPKSNWFDRVCNWLSNLFK